MSYEKTTWKTGDKVTAQKLNNIENGIENAGNAFSIKMESVNNTFVLDKTFRQIKEAMTNGFVVSVLYHHFEGTSYDDIFNQFRLTAYIEHHLSESISSEIESIILTCTEDIYEYGVSYFTTEKEISEYSSIDEAMDSYPVGRADW